MATNGFKVGERVSYQKRNHQYVRVNTIHADVERVSRNRVVIRDGFGSLHYVKPSNLTSLTY